MANAIMLPSMLACLLLSGLIAVEASQRSTEDQVENSLKNIVDEGDREIGQGIKASQILALGDFTRDDCRLEEIKRRYDATDIQKGVKHRDANRLVLSYFDKFATMCTDDTDIISAILDSGISAEDREKIKSLSEKLEAEDARGRSDPVDIMSKIEEHKRGGTIDFEEFDLLERCKRILNTLDIISYFNVKETKENLFEMLKPWRTIQNTCIGYMRTLDQ